MRQSEERSEELTMTTQLQAAKTAHARTSVQDAPSPKTPQKCSLIIPTLFDIRFAHRSTNHNHVPVPGAKQHARDPVRLAGVQSGYQWDPRAPRYPSVIVRLGPEEDCEADGNHASR